MDEEDLKVFIGRIQHIIKRVELSNIKGKPELLAQLDSVETRLKLELGESLYRQRIG